MIIKLLGVLLASSSAANAGVWSSFCERHIVADYPYPYDDSEFTALVRAYKGTHDMQMLDEIMFRYRGDRLTAAEREYFEKNFR